MADDSSRRPSSGASALEQKRNISPTAPEGRSRRRLLPRQALFADYCLIEASAARAAIRAGYSPRSAYNQAYRLLANDEIRRRIERGLAAMSAADAARRARMLELLDRAFEAAMECGRLEPALGALKAQAEVSGLIHRSMRPSPAQSVHACDDDDGVASGGAGVRAAPGKL